MTIFCIGGRWNFTKCAMTKEMEELIDKYWDEDQHNKIVELIMAVPETERDLDMMGQLVVAYNNLGHYDDAIKLSMELKEVSTELPAWYYRIGFALVYKCEYEKAADYLETGMALAKKQGDKNRMKNCQGLYNECLPHLSESRKGKRPQNEPLEIIWSEQEEAYVVIKGAVDLGYLGGYDIHQIEVKFGKYDFQYWSKERYMKGDGAFLKEYLREDMNHEEIAKGLTAFFNLRLQNITSHIVEINQAFLAYVIEDMNDCGYPFWEECVPYVFADKLPACSTDDIEKLVYSSEVDEGISELFNRYYEAPLNGEIDIIPRTEEFIRQMLPMFNYEKMLKDVHSFVLVLEVDNISFECTGEGEAWKLVCSACANIQNDNSIVGWNNH